MKSVTATLLILLISYQLQTLNAEAAETSKKPSPFENLFVGSVSEVIINEDGPKAQGTVKSNVNFIDSGLQDVIWCGEKKDTVFLFTNKGTLYRSKDDAFSGETVTDHLKKLGEENLMLSKGKVGELNRIEQSPIDPSTLIVLGNEGVSWITETCGDSFRTLVHGRPLEDFEFHPTERSWLLASSWTRCTEESEQPCKSYQELLVSKDLGVTWKAVADYVFQFSWALPSAGSKSRKVPKERIFIVHDPAATGNQMVGRWKSKLQASYSDDFFDTEPVKLIKGGNRLLLSENFLFVVQVRDESEQDVTLLVADPNQKEYTFRPIEVPTKRLLDHGYTVLDTSEHSVAIHTDHLGPESPFGNLYMSDSTGVRYSLALKGNVRNSAGQCDFEKVDGLAGVFLANIYEPEALKNFQKAMVELDDAFPFQSSGKKGERKGSKSMNTDRASEVNKLKRTLNQNKQTVITFDDGGIWKKLTPPDVDMYGKKVVCEEMEAGDECTLHLHSISSLRFGPFYSTENSLGLILGTGNVGTTLTQSSDEISTFMSRDGGYSWTEIAKGSHVYEVGDRGGLILMASNQNATTHVYYSWNQGQTWEILEFTEKPVQISNIVIEPTNTGEKFLIYGREFKGTKGVIIAVDFSSLHPRNCQGADQPSSAESDYETWVAGGPKTQGCHLGKQTTYIRKKRDAQCFNDENNPRWKIVDSCQCTEEDWECDYGFSRTGAGPCLPTSSSTQTPTGEAVLTGNEVCDDDGYYRVTQGYRKVNGDTCIGGVSHSPITVPCRGPLAWIRSNLSTLLLAVGILLAYLWMNSTSNKDKVKMVCGGLWNKFSSMFSRSPASLGYSNKFEGGQQLEGENMTSFTFEDVDSEDAALNRDRSGELRERKMTNGNTMEVARRNVPLLTRPEDRKKFDGLRGN